MAPDLAISLNRLAIELRNAGRVAEAIAASDRSIRLCEEPARAGDATFRSLLANALATKGNTLADRRLSLELYESAIQNLHGLDEPEALMENLGVEGGSATGRRRHPGGESHLGFADEMLAHLIDGERADLRSLLRIS